MGCSNRGDQTCVSLALVHGKNRGQREVSPISAEIRGGGGGGGGGGEEEEEEERRRGGEVEGGAGKGVINESPGIEARVVADQFFARAPLEEGLVRDRVTDVGLKEVLPQTSGRFIGHLDTILEHCHWKLCRRGGGRRENGGEEERRGQKKRRREKRADLCQYV